MSLDYEITLWTLARAGIPHLADGCVVDMVQGDGSVKRVAVAHVHSEKEDMFRSGDYITFAADVIRRLPEHIR